MLVLPAMLVGVVIMGSVIVTTAAEMASDWNVSYCSHISRVIYMSLFCYQRNGAHVSDELHVPAYQL